MSYPASLDNLPTVSTGQLVTSAYISSQSNAINNIENAFGLNPVRNVCEGRLTLTSGVPVPSSDQNTGLSTIYFTPFNGNRVALYDGSSAWNLYALSSDPSLLLSGLSTSTQYDLFLWNNGGVITLSHGTGVAAQAR